MRQASPSFDTTLLADAQHGSMNFLSNIDPALLECSTTPNPPMNRPITQDGSLSDGNSMPAGEPVYCSASLFSQPLSPSCSGRSVLQSHAQCMPVAPVNLYVIHTPIFKYNNCLNDSLQQ